MQYFLVPQLFNLNILEFDNGRIEAPRPKVLSSDHCIRRDDARHELGTVPKLNTACYMLPNFVSYLRFFWELVPYLLSVKEWGKQNDFDLHRNAFFFLLFYLLFIQHTDIKLSIIIVRMDASTVWIWVTFSDSPVCWALWELAANWSNIRTYPLWTNQKQCKRY